ncbi:MAG: MerR family DNA-binding transcriptional regulator, partial [Acidimicrobiia bacterium]
MGTQAQRFRVGELADRCDISVDTIRFYQKRGLLPPPDRVGRVGWYGP